MSPMNLSTVPPVILFISTATHAEFFPEIPSEWLRAFLQDIFSEFFQQLLRSSSRDSFRLPPENSPELLREFLQSYTAHSSTNFFRVPPGFALEILQELKQLPRRSYRNASGVPLTIAPPKFLLDFFFQISSRKSFRAPPIVLSDFLNDSSSNASEVPPVIPSEFPQ